MKKIDILNKISVINIMEERLNNNWDWAKAYFKRKSKELGLDKKGWAIGKNHTKTCLAICNHTKKKIYISSYYLKGDLCTHTSLRNTILHEMAHSICGPENGHNLYWKSTAIAIGCDGKVYGKMNIPKGKYLMYCPKRCFKKEYYRKINVQGRICIKCRSQVKLKSL